MAPMRWQEVLMLVQVLVLMMLVLLLLVMLLLLIVLLLLLIELLLLIVLLLLLLLVPLVLCDAVLAEPGGQGLPSSARKVFAACNLFTYTLYAADMVVEFNLAKQMKDGSLLTKRSHIAAHYLTSWFCIDFLTTIPWEYISGTSGVGLMKLLKLCRIGRYATVVCALCVCATLNPHHQQHQACV